MGKENVYIYTMEHHSAIKNNDIMTFEGKKIILSEVAKIQKDKHGTYLLINGY